VETSSPVGGLKPNDFGLFDVLGNAWEWCHAYDPDYASAGLAIDREISILPARGASIRGGAYNRIASVVRCADRWQRALTWSRPRIPDLSHDAGHQPGMTATAGSVYKEAVGQGSTTRLPVEDGVVSDDPYFAARGTKIAECG
jgi:hypothetical protein